MEQQRDVNAPPGSPTDPVFVPDSMIGSGIIRPGTPAPDDFELYLLHLATEYVSATKDVSFLLSEADAVHAYGETATHTVLEGLLAAQKFTLHNVGKGPHGLLRLLNKLQSMMPEGSLRPVSWVKKSAPIWCLKRSRTRPSWVRVCQFWLCSWG